jgi:hypothetical protein
MVSGCSLAIFIVLFPCYIPCNVLDLLRSYAMPLAAVFIEEIIQPNSKATDRRNCDTQKTKRPYNPTLAAAGVVHGEGQRHRGVHASNSGTH